MDELFDEAEQAFLEEQYNISQGLGRQLADGLHTRVVL